MLTTFDKAGAALGHLLGWDPEQTVALVTVINAVLVFLVPNKAVGA